MTGYTPLNALPYPQATDTANLPLHFQSMAEAIDGRTVLRYATAAARDTAITTPVAGMVAWLSSPGQLTHYTGTVWAPVAAVPVFKFNNDAGTTVSTTAVEVLTDSSTTAVTAAFTAPPTGQVIVSLGAYMYSSAAYGSYMSATIYKASDKSVFLASSADRAAVVNSTNRASCSTQFLVTGLTAGTVYNAVPCFWSANAASTATFDTMFVRVDPVL
ncbi:hypothetical protein OG824_15985 [Streptomyces prunicolor]|jgi:hypothetical protein|uniref:hypothetical protein n=1 Tax=Streptomyces prunicolor TaxID=67348 RepID=UPI0022553538|nr:hypothetical protein [Streptomyces prunicolor]MCX5236695.1 hypothetical protein [Streptomyces prunicolor]